VPVHDQGYRRYTGQRAPSGRAWLVIATSGLRMFLARRPLIGLLLLSWLPFVVRAVLIYGAVNAPQVSFLAVTPGTFRQFLQQQDPFAFFMTVYIGAGQIANDRRANALQVYLSKPITRTEYVVGKLAILLTFVLFITWVPAMLLLVVQIAFAGSFTFFVNHLSLVPAITALSLLEAIVASASMLALSSLSNNSRYVGILYTAAVFFSQALVVVLKSVTGEGWWSWISVRNDLKEVGDALFGLPLRNGAAWPISLVPIVALVLVSGLILERRVRGVEVVA
jgi:ABC-2 type transport system permease protein